MIPEFFPEHSQAFSQQAKNQAMEIEKLKNRISELENKIEEMHNWEVMFYSELSPMWSWFMNQKDLPESATDAVAIDQIDLERKADLKKKQEREANADRNQAGTVGNISGRYRKGEELQLIAGTRRGSGKVVEEVCENSSSGCGSIFSPIAGIRGI